MPNLTISLPPELYEKIKRHPEIRWSVVIRRYLEEFIKRLESRSEERTDELLGRLGVGSLLDEIPDGEAIRFGEKSVRERGRRAVRH